MHHRLQYVLISNFLFFFLSENSIYAFSSSPKLVFAHYMLCCSSYNNTVEGYSGEIQEAQSFGIDGFALNAGAWSNPNYYVNNAITMYQAALQLNSSFVLFISADMSGITNSSDIYDMVDRFYNHPNQFIYQDRPVLSTYSGKASPWWIEGAFLPLKEKGIDVYFVSDFSPFLYYASYDAQDFSFENYLWDFYVDGLFNFAAAALHTQDDVFTDLVANSPPIQSATRSRGRVAQRHNKSVMSGVNPHYWGAKQPTAGRRYFEYDGGESLASQWLSIIERINPEWVEIVTWNDLDEEGYVCPLESGIVNPWVFQFSANQAGDGNTSLNYYPSHKGTLALISYFITWFKNGEQPFPESDSIYWFYRKHPWQARATDDPFGPVTAFYGDINDTIYVTSILSQPATLSIDCGTNSTTLSLPAGLFHSRASFSPGLPKFTLSRNDQIILQAQGSDEIEAVPKYYNFHYSSNYATSSQTFLSPPTGLTGQAGLDWVIAQWNSYEGAIGYIIKSASSVTGSYSIIYKTDSTWMNITSLPTNTTIYISVSAVLSSGQITVDSAPLSLTPNNLPDLIITNISLDPPNPPPGSLFYVNATITNIGNGALTIPLHVFFEYDVNPGSYLFNNPPFTGIIEPGESVEINGNDYYYGGQSLWNAWGPQIHTVKAVVNPFPPGYISNIFPSSQVVETNYTNNEFVLELLILPDLTILSVSSLPASPSIGENTTLLIEIGNIGLVPTTNSSIIAFTYNNDIFSTLSFDTLLSIGGNTSVTSPVFEWLGWPQLVVYINLNPYPLFQEMSFSNNQYP